MFVLFLFFPFIAFLLSLRNLNRKSNALVFILFCGLFGYCQHFQLETADVYRIGLGFEDFNLMRDVLSEYEEGKKPDLYIHLTRFLIRPFTSNPKVYYGILGLIFGFLCYNFYKFIYRNWTRPKQGIFYVLMLLVLTSISLMDFTGVRTATAVMLFLCSAYRYIYCQKKIWIIGVLLSPLIHFYMWATVLVFFAYLITPMIVLKWHRLLKAALVVAFAVSLVDLSGQFGSLVEDNDSDIVNSSISNKAENYMNGTEGNAIARSNDNSLYGRANTAFFSAFRYINRFGVMVIMWFLINYMQRHVVGRPERKMYMFLFILSIAVIVSFSLSPVLGERFAKNWWMLLFVLFARLYCCDPKIPAKKLLLFMCAVNFNSIAFVFYNIPRLVEYYFWWYPVPLSIIKGWNFSIGLI